MTTVPRRFLLVSHSPLLTGGAEISLLEIALHLISQNHQVKIILPARGGFLDKLNELGIPSIVTPFRWSVASVDDLIPTSSDIGTFNADSIIDAFKIIREYKPDVVLSNTIVAPWYGYAAFANNIPHVLLVSEQITKINNLNPLPNISQLIRLLNMSTDVILYNSQYTQKFYEQYFNQKPSAIVYPVITIPKQDRALLTQHTQLSNNTSSPKIIVIGSITDHKNQSEAIEAIRILKQRNVTATLSILGGVGNKRYYQKLKKMVVKYNIAKQVTFLPHTSSPLETISSHDIVVVTSFETFGRITVEGQLMGKIVIGANQGGTQELITNRETGILYTPGKPEELAQSIIDCLKSPEISTHIAVTGQKQAIEKFIDKTSHSILDTALERLYSSKNDISSHIDMNFNPITFLTERNILVNLKLEEYATALSDCSREVERLNKELAALENSRLIRTKNRIKVMMGKK